MTDAARQAGHALLDAVVTPDLDSPDLPTAGRVMNVAAQRLLEVGAVEVGVDGSGDDVAVNVDLSALLGGCLILVSGLVDRVALAQGIPREQVVAETRQVLDRAFE